MSTDKGTRERARGPSGEVPPIQTAGQLRDTLERLGHLTDDDGAAQAYDTAADYTAALEIRSDESPRRDLFWVAIAVMLSTLVAIVALTVIVAAAWTTGMLLEAGAVALVTLVALATLWRVRR